MTISNVQSNDSNDTFRFALEAVLVMAGIAAVTAVAKPIAKRLFEKNLPMMPVLTNNSSRDSFLNAFETIGIIESATAKSRAFSLLLAPVGAAAGELCIKKALPFFLTRNQIILTPLRLEFGGFWAASIRR